MSIPCSSCAVGLPEGARFCFSCGAAQVAPACTACAEPLVPGARFCFACGTPTGAGAGPGSAPGTGSGAATPVASRRVTSVLFGDLVGFTALSEVRDQEEVRELLSRYFEECRRVVERYGGVVEKFIGDAVMAVFGVPTAHEDDAERAVRAGLELVDAVTSLGEEAGIADLDMRVGVVTGEVAVTVGATQQGMVAGDAVNTAARVQSAASPGQVWVDETTRLLTASAITYLDVGSHAMKGKADPVPLWAVRAVVAAMGGAQRADGLESPLVGRDRELRLTKDLFHAAEDAVRPMLLVVDGEPGVGKTRLVWEFEKYTDGLSGTVSWHRGRCLAYGEGVAFFALAEAVRGRLRSVDEEPVDGEAESDVVDRGLERLVPEPAERAWLRPRVEALLGVGSVRSFPTEDLFSAWTTFFERAGDGDPVVLVIDDAQHADEGLLQFVEHLLTVGDFPCFVVLLARPGLLEDRPTLALNRRSTVVHLEALPAADMGRLLGGLVAGLPDQVREQLVDRSEGVPLYAVETVRSLIDRDLVVPRGGQYVLADDAALDLGTLAAPASLQALVAARLDGLSEDQRRLVDRASVVGESFSREALVDLSPDLADVPRTLETLVRQQILSQETRRFSAELGRYSFVQSVVRQVAYSQLSRRDRKALHLEVAALIEAQSDTDDLSAVVAQHYLDAAEAVPDDPDADGLRDSAVEHLSRAAARASSLGSPGEAAGHLSVAIRLVSEPARLGELESALAAALYRVGRHEESCRHAELAEQLLLDGGDEVGAARAAITRSIALGLGVRDIDASEAAIRPWWERFEGRADQPEIRSELCSSLVAAQTRRGVNDWSLLEAQVRLAELVGDPRSLSEAYSSLGIYYAGIGSLQLSRLLLNASADLARENHDPVALARTLNNLAADAILDDLDRAVATGREGSAVSTAAGLSVWRSYTDTNLVMALYARGDWDELEVVLRDDERCPDDANVLVWSLVGGLLARARADEPVLDIPVERLTDAGEESVDLCWVHVCAALAAERQGDRVEASRRARDAVAVQNEFAGIWDDMAFIWPFALELAMAADDDEGILALRQVASTEQSTAVVPLALRVHERHGSGLLAVRADDLDAAERHLRQALEDCTRWGSVCFRGRIALDLAAVLERTGRVEEASALAAPAVADLERLSAHAWLAGTQRLPV